MKVGALELYAKKVDDIHNCQTCHLHKTCLRPVPGRGDLRSKIVLVGEAPGADEDLYNKPFVGRAGKHLDRVLKAAGLNREELYVTNIVKCRPPDNREPKLEEVTWCINHLITELIILDPRVVVTMGNYPTQNYIGMRANRVPRISVAREKYYIFQSDYLDRHQLVYPVYHPSYSMRQGWDSKETTDTIHDFIKLREFMEDMWLPVLSRNEIWLQR